eukprot:2335501-Pyramimonas_sp.AAC.1
MRKRTRSRDGLGAGRAHRIHLDLRRLRLTKHRQGPIGQMGEARGGHRGSRLPTRACGHSCESDRRATLRSACSRWCRGRFWVAKCRYHLKQLVVTTGAQRIADSVVAPP